MIQINDVDVSQCREGRHNYLGMVSFILIAILMSCLLLNETIGDAVIDAIIPCIYSAILYIGSALYNYSLFALLFPFCIVIGVLLYRAFVYLPAKEAHNRRKARLGRKTSAANNINRFQQRGHKHSDSFHERKVHGYFGYYIRLLSMAKYGILTGIANLSFRTFKKHRAREISNSQQWCLMNMLDSYHDTALSRRGPDEESKLEIEEESKENDEDDLGVGASVIVDASTVIEDAPIESRQSRQLLRVRSIPNEIERMMISTMVSKAVAAIESRQSSFTSLFGVSDNQSQSRVLVNQNLVVMKTPVQGSVSREFQPVIIFDTGDALLHIWSNVSCVFMQELLLMEEREGKWKAHAGKGKSKEGDEVDGVEDALNLGASKDSEESIRIRLNGEIFEIPVDHLFEELQNVFDFFYPDGICMTAAERAEVGELFDDWVQGLTAQYRKRYYGDECFVVQTVSYKYFHCWFYNLTEMIHHTMSERLLNYMLIQTNTSVTSAPMKFLNMVAPKYQRDTDATLHARSQQNRTITDNRKVNPFAGGPRKYTHPFQEGMVKVVHRDDLYSTYPSNRYVYPRNRHGGGPRNFARPQHREHLNDSEIIHPDQSLLEK